MDDVANLLSALVGKGYVEQGLQSISSRRKHLKSLLSSKEMPDCGLDDIVIEYILQELAMMDSNNFAHNIGAGEREGRVFSPLVSKRHFGLAHGIGRSGDISEVQPKSAGSSLIYKLANILVTSALKVFGLVHVKEILLLPMATGMSIAICLNALRTERPNAKYVIWSRIDQKSCFKSILFANLVPIIVQNVLLDDALVTNLPVIEELITQYGDEILCVLSTTSCFAPRCPDKIDEIAKICQRRNIPHVINHAYGLQSASLCKLLNRAMCVGRVDYVISSLDKNFMVPVGGAVVYSQHAGKISLVSSLYPGRASIAPILDVFITTLAMGKNGLQVLLRERENNMILLKTGLKSISEKHCERELIVDGNPISFGITLDNLGGAKESTFLGSMLFQRCVSGTRVVAQGARSDINGFVFEGWGSHYIVYPHTYLTAACALGMTADDIQTFLGRLDHTITRIVNRRSKTTVNNLENSVHTVDKIEEGTEEVGEDTIAADV